MVLELIEVRKEAALITVGLIMGIIVESVKICTQVIMEEIIKEIMHIVRMLLLKYIDFIVLFRNTVLIIKKECILKNFLKVIALITTFDLGNYNFLCALI